MVKSKNMHVCSNCLNLFDSKDIHVSECVNNSNYLTTYCTDCIHILEIKNSVPYLKSKKRIKL